MHSQAMIHADLKGVWFRTSAISPPNVLSIKANILVDQKGCARLADFGLLTIVSDPTYSTTSSSRTNAGTTRWMSPELLDQDRFCSKNCRPTKESDCYALGMVILEVLTGQVPFPRYSGLIVMRKVIEGEHPDRPQGAERVWFTDYLWGTLEWCWQPQPETRPTIQTVLEHLERASTDWQPLPPSAGGDVEADSDDELTLTVSRPGMSPHSLANPGPISLLEPIDQMKVMQYIRIIHPQVLCRDAAPGAAHTKAVVSGSVQSGICLEPPSANPSTLHLSAPFPSQYYCRHRLRSLFPQIIVTSHR